VYDDARDRRRGPAAAQGRLDVGQVEADGAADVDAGQALLAGEAQHGLDVDAQARGQLAGGQEGRRVRFGCHAGIFHINI
jgi:hypothetical protein